VFLLIYFVYTDILSTIVFIEKKYTHLDIYRKLDINLIFLHLIAFEKPFQERKYKKMKSLFIF